MAIPSSPRHIEPMSPSNVDNIAMSPPSKRKVEATVDSTPRCAEGKENGVTGKRIRLDTPATPTLKPLLDSHKRRLAFKQSSYVIEVPRRRRLDFEAFLLDAEESKTIITSVPDHFLSIIAAAGHELASATEAHFLIALKKALNLKDLADVIPSDVWTSVISSLFTLRQYGFIPSDFPSSSTGPRKIPAALQIRYWEVTDPAVYFTEDQNAIVTARRTEREKAREQVLAVLQEMDDVEVLELLKGDKERVEKEETSAKKSKTVERVSQDSPAPSIGRKSREGTAASTSSRRSASPVKRSKMTPEEEQAAKVKQEEKEARRLEKEKLRAAKEAAEAAKRQELEKKEAAKAKQQATMNSFFLKPKPVVKSTKPPAIEDGPSEPKPKPKFTDFEKTFKPIQIRPNVDWAPVNHFRYKRRRSTSSTSSHEVVPDAADWQSRDFLADHSNRHGKASSGSIRRHTSGLKTNPSYGSVGDIWTEYQESSDPRKVLARLKKNHRYPWKTLAFDGQIRPPYSGTFTKKSAVVGPRTPFALDPIFDYSYDSGDDWQDDEGGEDVDEPQNQEPEEVDEMSDEEEGEFDDWLDDSEDVTFEPTPMDIDDEDRPIVIESKGGEQQRIPMKVIKRKEPAVKRVVKVVPFWKGPMWEKEIGEISEDMKVYSIQLLNDTPDSVDPFSYTSYDSIISYKPAFITSAIGMNMSVKTLVSVEASNPIVHIESKASALTEPASTTKDQVTIPPTASSSATKPRPVPKQTFPDSHLAELLHLIEGNTKIKTDLISQLRSHFESVTSKAAIEQKVKEVAAREGKNKDSAWRVLPSAWIAVGLTPPNKEPSIPIAPPISAVSIEG